MALSGTIKWYNAKLGYGFIHGEDGEDVFVHYSAVTDGRDLAEGEAVTFQVAAGPRGPLAAQVEHAAP